MSEDFIPIQNVYYLLCYAWNKLEERDLIDVGRVDSTELVDLFAHVLISGTNHLFRRGLDRGYLEHEEDLRGIRGRVQLTASVKRLQFPSGRATCCFDELSYDVLPNQILRTTLFQLARVRELSADHRRDLVKALQRFPAVTHIPLTGQTFRRVQLHRNNAFYAFLMNVCELVHQSLLPDETQRSYRFRDFMRDEQKMAGLFEAFVRNFYARELPNCHVAASTINWDAEAANPQHLDYLPQMRTDITIRFADRTVIIDTKYYSECLQEHRGKFTVHSSNLYQVFSYVKNLETCGTTTADRSAEGILLYPVVRHTLDLPYRIQGHIVRIVTLDLAQEWKCIHQQLLDIVRADRSKGFQRDAALNSQGFAGLTI